METQRNNLKVTSESALLVNVTLPDSPLGSHESLAELRSLVEAAGANVVGYVIQKRQKVNPALYVGTGKAHEIDERAKMYGANVVIFDNDLSPAQIRELEKIVKCKVIDRSELILDIFASRARTAEARLQVDLAQLEYTYPRLTRMWSHLDTVVGGAGGGAVAAVGGIGTRGTGESQLEIDRRLVQKRISQLKRQIDEIDKRKQRQVNSRNKHYTISLVGYTNAGKSTLMNTLTGSETYVADQLFATLDTKTAKWNLSGDMHVLLSDTVGFVRDLPHHLVASFRATLEEAIYADLLLHVIDISHPHADLQIKAVNEVLRDLKCMEKDIVLVFNKADKPGITAKRDLFMTLYPDAICVSARSGEGLENLVDLVTNRVTGRRKQVKVACSHSDGKIPQFIRKFGLILSEEYTNSHIELLAELSPRQIESLERLNPISCEIV